MNFKHHHVTIVVVLLWLASAVGAQGADQYWQVMFSYGPAGLSAVEADAMPPVVKGVRTPGLAGAPVRIGYIVEWLDAGGGMLQSTTTEMPVGFLTAPAESSGCRILIPDAGSFVVRLAGPNGSAVPAALRLTQTVQTLRFGGGWTIPPAFDFTSEVLPLQRVNASSRAQQGPISATKIRATGPDNNRLVIVILGDGYTAANLSAGSFTADAENAQSAFMGKSPWDLMFNGTNVYRIDVESNEQGADNDPLGTYRDTYFNSTFYNGGIARALVIDGVGYNRAVAAANSLVGVGMWDELLMLVNSPTYGGTGGSISVSSVHPLGPEIVLHELGHTFAQLADEYTDPYPGFPPGDGEPNVDYDYSGPGLKWLAWVNPSTPLPTPVLAPYYNKVGAFQGARYLTTGIYRPSYNCLMRELGIDLDPVCKEAHLGSYTGYVKLTDSVIPSAGTTVMIPLTGRTFTVAPIPIGAMHYQWALNGVSFVSATDSQFTLRTTDLYRAGLLSTATLQLTVSYLTPLMKMNIPTQVITWTAAVDCNGNGVRDQFDLSNHTSQDANFNSIPDECDALICCHGTTGNIDGDPGEIVDISDVSAMVDYLTTTYPISPCFLEDDVDKSGAIDISDLMALIDFLSIGRALPTCPF